MSGGAVAAQALGDIASVGIPMIYNHWLTKKTWEREDNAAQRRMEDLRKAGLNPVLAAGGSAAAASGGHAMQQYSPQDYITRSAELDAARLNNQSLQQQIENLRTEGLNLQKDIEVKDENIQNLKATRANTTANTAATNQETNFARIDAERNQGIGLTRHPSAAGAIVRDIIGGADKLTEFGGKALGDVNSKEYKERLQWYLREVSQGKMSIREAMTKFARENYERNRGKQ